MVKYTQMIRFLILLTASLLLSGVRADSNAVIRTTRELKAFRTGLREERRRLDLTGTVLRVYVGGTVFVLEDATGRAPLYCRDVTVPRPGDVVRIIGRTLINDKLEAWDHPEQIAVIGRLCTDEPIVAVKRSNVRGCEGVLRVK